MNDARDRIVEAATALGKLRGGVGPDWAPAIRHGANAVVAGIQLFDEYLARLENASTQFVHAANEDRKRAEAVASQVRWATWAMVLVGACQAGLFLWSICRK